MATPHKTASGRVEESPLVLIDVTTAHGRQGHGVVFTCNAAALKSTADLATNIGLLLEGEELAPTEITAKPAGRFRLLGTQGLLGMALAGIGGVTGWMRAAALGEAHSIRLSNHLWPEISAQLLCATPTAHWLEYADWWNPVVKEPLRIVNGDACLDGVVGTGLEWNESAVARYAA